MEIDEAGTLIAFQARLKGIFEPTVKTRGGRIVKLMGDGTLVEFASAVNAVEAALELQDKFNSANAGLAEDRRIKLRIGINIGDVVSQGDDIFGDGVNVAARLENLAEPGGVCVSGKVRDEVQGKIEADFADLGERKLKNIASAVRAYSVARPGGNAFALPRPTGAQVGWVDPDKPSIAVLRFLNMSSDAEQEYLSDGITEDIITELSRFKNLFVISRNSSFRFSAMSARANEIGRQLSAKYVVEGSVRRVGGRTRVTAQLIETATDGHLWAERYDREFKDIFEVQDDVVRSIAGVIPGVLERRTLAQSRRKPTEDLNAYECELRGRWAYSHTDEGIAKAIHWYERAIEADPDYALALAGLAQALSYGVFMLGANASEAFAKAGELIARAVALDNDHPEILRCAGYVNFLSGKNDAARSFVERALELNPNDYLTIQAMGEVLSYGGRLNDALEWFTRSAKLVPYAPNDRRLDLLCEVYYMLGEYEKVRQVFRAYPSVQNYCPIAAACVQTGDLEGAEWAKARFLSEFSFDAAAAMLGAHLQMCVRTVDREHWIDGYRKAGLPV